LALAVTVCPTPVQQVQKVATHLFQEQVLRQLRLLAVVTHTGSLISSHRFPQQSPVDQVPEVIETTALERPETHRVHHLRKEIVAAVAQAAQMDMAVVVVAGLAGLVQVELVRQVVMAALEARLALL
jgi:hypothetical protein